MPDSFADIDFPDKGLDLAMGFEAQREGTCCEGLNVVTFEPTTDRARGGSRAGLTRFISEQLPLDAVRTDISYPHLIQHLNIVVYGATAALFDGDDPTDPDLIDDPSSAGPPSSWGHGPLDYDWDGLPITGASQSTRNPFPGRPKKRRQKGSGRQPNKNSVQPAAAGATYLYQCQAEVLINAPGNTFDGTTPAFNGCACVGATYLALAGAPTSSLQFSRWHVNRLAYFALHGIPEGTWSLITSSDLIIGPVRVCTPSDVASGCTQIFTGNPGTYPG